MKKTGWLFIMLLTVFTATAQAPMAKSKRLLIVAPQTFYAALKEFVQHKKKLLPTELVSLEKTLKTSKGVDDPEKLKRFLYDAWKKHRVGYVLLVGDCDMMPVRYMVLDRITPEAFDYAFYPSDLYYADLAKPDGSFEDWNARKEDFHATYFGEVRGEKNKQDPINFDRVDYKPEIAVGRWPLSTPEEVRLLASKTIRYEQTLLKNKENRKQAGFFSVGGWVDSRPLMKQLADKLSGWQSALFLYQDTSMPDAVPPDEKRIVGLVNQGSDLILHAGHGSESVWEGCLSINTIAQFKNADRLPVMFSVGCSTAYFAPLPPYEAYTDIAGVEHAGTNNKQVFAAPPPAPAPYQKGKYNPTGLGEQLLKRSLNGAVAYIGCNTGSQPCGLTLLEGFVMELSDASEPRLGDCWVSAIRYYYEKEHLAELKPDDGWYPSSIFFQAMKFMLFGDPSLRM
jgi:hypothetical protein